MKRVHVDINKPFPSWRTEVFRCDENVPDEEARKLAAEHFGVPLGQVSEMVFVGEIPGQETLDLG